jgi:hypothetical protein
VAVVEVDLAPTAAEAKQSLTQTPAGSSESILLLRTRWKQHGGLWEQEEWDLAQSRRRHRHEAVQVRILAEGEDEAHRTTEGQGISD